MLVLVGPSFDGSTEGFAKLAAAAGLVAYDLRSRIKPGHWGVVRALADRDQALDLVARLRREAFPAVCVDMERALGPERKIVKAQALRLEATELVLRVREREMPLPFAAVLAIVRGEVGADTRPPPRSAGPSSAAFRAVVGGVPEVSVFREGPARPTDTFQAADLHFHTVRWIARIDPRSMELAGIPGLTGIPLRDLELVTSELASRTGVRVDQGSRMSSLAPYASSGHRMGTPVPGPLQDAPLDRFDGYSRLVGEAELELFRARKRE